MITFEELMKQFYYIHSLHIWGAIEKLIWHHILVHPCYQYIHNAQKYIDGFPKFIDATSKLLYQCYTFIQSKMSKTPPVHGTNHVDIQPYQGLSFFLYL